MTRKDYIKIAEVLRESKREVDVSLLASKFAEMLKADNTRFDPAKFFKAVYLS